MFTYTSIYTGRTIVVDASADVDLDRAELTAVDHSAEIAAMIADLLADVDGEVLS